MANHKRKRAKTRRSGCLLCKPSKLPAVKHGDKAKARRQWQENEEKGNG